MTSSAGMIMDNYDENNNEIDSHTDESIVPIDQQQNTDDIVKDSNIDYEKSNENSRMMIASDDDDDEEEDIDNNNVSTTKSNTNTATPLGEFTRQQQQQKEHNNNSNNALSSCGHSVFYAPYRTLGIVTGSASFHLIPNDNSSNALLCCSLGDRFCLYRTQHLQPALISQTVPALIQQQNTKNNNNNNTSRVINFCLTDSSMSITIIAHGPISTESSASYSSRLRRSRTDVVTLYQRTTPTQSIQVGQHGWNVHDMIIIGKVKQAVVGNAEKEGVLENTLLIAVVLAKNSVTNNNNNKTQKRTSHDDNSSSSSSSDHNDDISDNDSSSNGSSSDEMEEDGLDDQCMGKVVILVATRTSMKVQSEMSLVSIPDFFPTSVIHPVTYLNKILIGGSRTCTTTTIKNNYNNRKSIPALSLVNIRSKKIVHNFTSLASSNSNNGLKLDEFVTVMEQSPAVDTIAVGTNTGVVHLINIRHDVKLFTLNHISTVSITSLSFRNDGAAVQYGIAPLAVGRWDGTITIWDLTAPNNDNNDDDSDDGDGGDSLMINSGRTILTEIHNAHVGGVSKIQYVPHEPLLLSTGICSNSIKIYIFDNPDHTGRILRQRSGHTAAPALIRYKYGTNSILANAADGTDPSLSCNILSTGGYDRTVRIFSTVRSSLDKELSQGKGLQKKAKKFGLDTVTDLLLPRVVGLALCDARDRRSGGSSAWYDLVTIHENHSMAYLWNTKDGAQSGPVLRQNHWNISSMKQQPPPRTHATSVAVSSCGNLALIGTKGGVIYKYNIQSGIPRGSYPIAATDETDPNYKSKMKTIGNVNRTMKALEKSMKMNDNRRSNVDRQYHDAEIEMQREEMIRTKLQVASHDGYEVTGIAVDATNKTLVSVGTDCKLIVWHFSNHTPHKKAPIQLQAPATRLLYNRDSDLAAIALQDYTIILFDCTALTIVRRFGSAITEGIATRHTGSVCDMAFSPDGRTLLTAAHDSTIRVWDIPSNSCIDWLAFKAPPTSITISPTGEFLATTHVGKVGISLWSDKSFYQNVGSDSYDLTKPILMDEPVPIGDANTETFTDKTYSEFDDAPFGTNKQASGGVANDETSTVIPKAHGLITLSGLPASHWKNLFHLELVKERNKPTEAPKKPPTAPFFLQYRPGESLTTGIEDVPVPASSEKLNVDDDAEEWAAAWSDDAEDDTDNWDTVAGNGTNDAVRTERANHDISKNGNETKNNKRRKISHFRSHLASLLVQCNESGTVSYGELRYQKVSEYIASLGPSAIDVAFSTLCNGEHDLEEGLPLLLMTCEWLQEACEARARYDALNAYLHRFLYLHGTIIAGIEQEEKEVQSDKRKMDKIDRYTEERANLVRAISKLRKVQSEASQTLRGKMEHTVCLLRHFSRMV